MRHESPAHVSLPGSPGFGIDVPRPFRGAGLGVERFDEAAALAAAAHDDQTLGGKRHRPLEAFALLRRTRFPQRIASASIERDERRILRHHVDHVAVDADAALPSDARRLPHVFPDEAAGRGIERVHAVVLADIHHALIDNRRRLEILRTGEMEDPLRLEIADIGGVDLLQRGMPLRVVRPGVQQEVIRVGTQQIFVGDLCGRDGPQADQERSD